MLTQKIIASRIKKTQAVINEIMENGDTGGRDLDVLINELHELGKLQGNGINDYYTD